MSGDESADEERVNEINRTVRASAGESTIDRENNSPADDRQTLDAIRASGATLRSRVRHLRRRVNDNGYDCPLKLSIALDRMIAKVVETQ